MAAVFELKTVAQDWRPPFKKTSTVQEVTVNAGDVFCDDGKGNFVFKLLQMEGDRALVEFDREYTVKGYEIPTNRKIWIDKLDFKSFSALWQENGSTKMLKLKQSL